MIKKCIKIIALIIVICTVFSGCAVRTDPDESLPDRTISTQEDAEPVVLRVLVEEGRVNTDTFYTQILNVVEQFEKEHSNIRIVLEKLPDNLDAREIALQEYRVEIMAGKGPDVLLLPSQGQESFDYMNMKEQLIPDINVAMRNGIFLDIGTYYDADEALGKEALQQTVMDAGILDGARYVLPLQYSFPAVFYEEERLTEAGLSEETLQSGVVAIMDAVTQLDDPELVGNAYLRHLKWMILDFFPELLDYEEQEVLLTKDRIVDFMDSYQAFWAGWEGAPHSVSADFGNFVLGLGYWGTDGHCLQIANMDTAVCQAALAKANGIDLKMLPLTGVDGKLVAEVTMYGAVCAGSKNPESAYAFLREFLLEPVQWEQDLPTSADRGTAEGYPVRVLGSVEPLYSSIYKREIPEEQLEEEEAERRDLLESVKITDEDVPILRAQIDEARFPISDLERELANMVELELNDPSTGAPLDADIDALAQTFVDDLKWHLFES